MRKQILGLMSWCLIKSLSAAALCSVWVPTHSGHQAYIQLLLLHGWHQANTHSHHLHCPAYLEHRALHPAAGGLCSTTELDPGHSTRESTSVTFLFHLSAHLSFFPLSFSSFLQCLPDSVVSAHRESATPCREQPTASCLSCLLSPSARACALHSAPAAPPGVEQRRSSHTVPLTACCLDRTRPHRGTETASAAAGLRHKDDVKSWGGGGGGGDWWMELIVKKIKSWGWMTSTRPPASLQSVATEQDEVSTGLWKHRLWRNRRHTWSLVTMVKLTWWCHVSVWLKVLES